MLLHRCRREGCTTAAFDRAAMNNHVDVVLWLTKNRTEGGTESALQFAVSRGHKKVRGNVAAYEIISSPRFLSMMPPNSEDTQFLKHIRFHLGTLTQVRLQ